MSEPTSARNLLVWRVVPIVVLCCTCTICIAPIFGLPIELFFNFGFGWLIFLWQSAQRMTIHWSGVATALICLVGVLLGCQWLCGWLYANLNRSCDTVPKPKWPWRWTCQLVGGVILLFLSGIGSVGISYQTGRLLSSEPLLGGGVGFANERSRSQQNLKEQASAVHNYASVYKDQFPPGALVDAKGRLLHGWQVHLLPFLEQDQLYRSIQLDRPWNDPTNEVPFRTQVRSYQHLGVSQRTDEAGFALSHYSANVHVLGGDVSRSFADFAEQGSSNVLLIGEINSEYPPWGKPGNWREPALGLNRSPKGFGGPIKSIVYFGLLDGSVRTFRSNSDSDFLLFLSGQPPTSQEQLNGDQREPTLEPKR